MAGFDEALFIALDFGGRQSVHGLEPIMEKMNRKIGHPKPDFLKFLHQGLYVANRNHMQ